MSNCSYKEVNDQLKTVEDETLTSNNVPWLKKPQVRQVAVISGVWASYFQIGLCYGTCPVLVAQLRREPLTDGTVIDDEKASWISSAGSFSGVLCVLLLALMGEYLGKKLSYIFMSLASCAGFVVLYYANSVSMVILAQILQGPLFGGATIICLVLAAECISPKYRGICMSINGANCFWAIWLANAIGTFFHWRIIGFIGMASAIYGALVISVCPESPYWLASKGRIGECREAHRWFRGVNENSIKDLECLIKSEMGRPRNIEENTNLHQRMLFYLNQMSAREFYRPMCLCILLSILFQLSGKVVLSVYVIDIIKKITVSESAAYTGMLILDGTTVLAMYIGSIIYKCVTRRMLFFSTQFSTIVSLLVISSYLYLIKLDLVKENVYLSISLLVVFSMAVTLGPMVLIYTFIVEIMPLKLRTFAAVLQCLTANVAGSVTLKVAPWIFSSLGTHGAFAFFGLSSLVCTMVLLKYLPETKDKTLEEIESFFKKRENSREMKE